MSKRKIHFPKGEGIKIINKPSDANVNNSIYILPISKQTAEIIILDKVGNRRKIGFSMPDNLALTDILTPDGEITERGNVYLKEQIDNLLKTEKEERVAVDNALKNSIDTEAGIRETKDTELDEKIASVSSQLDRETSSRREEDGTLNDKIINLQERVRQLSEWKSLMVDEDSDEVINTISDLINAFNDLPEGSNVLELLGKKVNIASIVDNLESELGNVPLSANQGRVLKTKIETLKGLIDTVNTELTKKLDKPTEEGTTETHPYVVGVDTEGNSVKLPAGDLGKNIANNKLISVAGAGLVFGGIWGIKTNGFPFRIEDLPDVTGSPTHQKKIMIGDDLTVGVSNKADISFELPNTMTVNHIYPQINEPVVYPEELAEFLKTYRTKQFTYMREEDWFYNYNENDITPLKLFNGNVITTASSIRAGSNGVQVGNWSLMSKKFPFNKKFIIELSISSDLSNFHQWGNNKIGICQNGNENSFNQAFSDFFTFSSEMVKIGEQFFNFKVSFRVIFAHIQDTLFIVALSGEAGKMASKMSNINDFFGDFSILMTGGDHAFGSPNRTGIEMKYWVES